MSDHFRISRAHFSVSTIAFFLGACMALMQALSRANLPLPFRSESLYYLSMTAHGVLMALVFTTFFIMGLGYVFARTTLGREHVNEKVGWIAFWVALVGTAMTAAAILTGSSTVLYTFYPPLQAHPTFYIGATILIVGTWIWCWVMIQAYRGWRRNNEGQPIPLAMHAMLATIIVWILATIGVAAESLFLLIPWSLGLKATIDPVLARTLFWWFGHPLVYFWLIPAYGIWYAVLPKIAGGRLFSDRLARVVFVLFILLSTPVGLHHQFTDPGIPAGWKLAHTFSTFAILFPSLLTAFTIIASLEVAGRMRGGKGLFGWIRRIPWGDPLVASVLLAMIIFAIGGFGGAINAAYAMNAMVHNTAWIHGHFHLTVGTASALTFMGATYWLLPRVTGKKLHFRAAAQVQPWLWAIGMLLFGVVNHVTGILGMPRRVFDASYAGSPIAARWEEWTTITAVGGVVLFVSAMMFVLVVAGTLWWGEKDDDAPAIEYAVPLAADEPATSSLWDRMGMWTVVASILVVIAYAYPIISLLSMERFGSPGFKPF